MSTFLLSYFSESKCHNTEVSDPFVTFFLFCARFFLTLASPKLVHLGKLGFRWIVGLAFIPISMYNGRRGFIQGSFAKYIFYGFYPVHLLVLYFIKMWINQ